VSTAPLITLADFKVWHRVADTSQDARLQALIVAATRNIETVCRNQFTYGARTEFHASRDSVADVLYLYGYSEIASGFSVEPQSFSLKSSPVDLTQPITVWYDPCLTFTDVTTQIAADRYSVDPDTGRLTLRAGTRQGVGTIRVDYTAGFAVGDDGTLSGSAPDDLKLACCWQALYLEKRMQPDNIGLDIDRGEGKTMRARWVSKGGLVEQALDLVMPYRRTLVGSA
jgi:hypothetical protein